MRIHKIYNHDEILKICKKNFRDIITIDDKIDNVKLTECFYAIYNRTNIIPFKTEPIIFQTNVEKLCHTKFGGCKQLDIDVKFSKFIERANKKFGNKFTFYTSEYIDTDTDIEIYCPIHGYFKIRPDHFIGSKYGCQKCGRSQYGLSVRKGYAQFVIKARNKFGDNFSYDEMNFTTLNNPIKITCLKHNHTFEYKPSKHLITKYGGCKFCYADENAKFAKLNCQKLHEITRIKPEKVKENLIAKYGEYFEFPEQNFQQSKKVKLQCKNCGNIFEYKPSYLMFKNVFFRCPICNRYGSKLEDNVYNILHNEYTNIERWKHFEWLKSDKDGQLEIDIFLSEYNIGIECQGKQHFVPVRFNKRYTDKEIEERYQRQIETDIIKYNKCKDHGIQLLYFSNNENLINTTTFYCCITDINELINRINLIIAEINSDYVESYDDNFKQYQKRWKSTKNG